MIHQFAPTVDAIANAFIVPGITMNLLLLYLIKRFSGKEIGTYGYLLSMFAAYDIFIILLNYLLIPRVIVMRYILAVALEVSYKSKILTCFHSISFMVSYAILITHFVYRYWIVTAPYKIEVFSTITFYVRWILLVLCFCTLLILITDRITSSENSTAGNSAVLEYREKYGEELKEGWVVFDYTSGNNYNLPVIFLTLFYNSIGTLLLTVVTTLATITYRHIAASFSISTPSRNVQLRLLVTACVQTLIPVVCVSLPFFCNMNMPLLGYPLPAISECSSLFLALFPTWDPLALIILMKPYRRGVISMFTRHQKEVEVVHVRTNATI